MWDFLFGPAQSHYYDEVQRMSCQFCCHGCGCPVGMNQHSVGEGYCSSCNTPKMLRWRLEKAKSENAMLASQVRDLKTSVSNERAETADVKRRFAGVSQEIAMLRLKLAQYDDVCQTCHGKGVVTRSVMCECQQCNPYNRGGQS